MSDTSNILEKIKKLQAIANDKGVSFEEASLFAAKISDLLTRYNLTEEDIKNYQSSDDKIMSSDLPVSSGISATWFRKMAQVTAELYYSFCYLEFIDDKQKPSFTKDGVKFAQIPVYHFIGRKANREIASLMFNYFVDTSMRLSRNFSNKVSDQNDFRKGFCLQMTFRLMEKILNRKYPDLINPDNLPALIDTTKKEIDLFIQDKGLSFSSRNITTVWTNKDALTEGIKAGKDVFLGNQVGSDQLNKLKIDMESDKRLLSVYGRT